MIRPADTSDIPALAELHASAFRFAAEYWNPTMLADSLASPGTMLLAAWEGPTPAAFILFRCIADIAEILTLATSPQHQRKGMATRLIQQACRAATEKSATAMLLDAAVDNVQALALYEKCGFREIGRRKGYYTRPAGRVDALTMKLVLTTEA